MKPMTQEAATSHLLYDCATGESVRYDDLPPSGSRKVFLEDAIFNITEGGDLNRNDLYRKVEVVTEPQFPELMAQVPAHAHSAVFKATGTDLVRYFLAVELHPSEA